jgi:hypothetical protein
MPLATSVLSVGLAIALAVAGCSGADEGSTTTTTSAPTTTLDPIAAEEAAVSEAARQARLSLVGALVNVDDPEAVAALDEWYVDNSPARQTADESLDDLRSENWRARFNPTIPDSLLVERTTFLGGRPFTEAELTVCVVSAGILYEPNAAPDGSDVVIDDAVVTYRLLYLMSKQDNTWKLRSVTELEKWEGVTVCPGSPS